MLPVESGSKYQQRDAESRTEIKTDHINSSQAGVREAFQDREPKEQQEERQRRQDQRAQTGKDAFEVDHCSLRGFYQPAIYAVERPFNILEGSVRRDKRGFTGLSMVPSMSSAERVIVKSK
jgi:hypothetical protein